MIQNTIYCNFTSRCQLCQLQQFQQVTTIFCVQYVQIHYNLDIIEITFLRIQSEPTSKSWDNYISILFGRFNDFFKQWFQSVEIFIDYVFQIFAIVANLPINLKQGNYLHFFLIV
ncbi:hypothetical protein FGO68_gene1418 [Halteria grandinella]|uniref:Uncharacterized protein n=1 Tax=Halteria grandinella TaxID=5974 RepID=A0A8J8NI17_HALGN|nr:hypothetical protein FGO68_gene1418 [Halteria grandinella]